MIILSQRKRQEGMCGQGIKGIISGKPSPQDMADNLVSSGTAPTTWPSKTPNPVKHDEVQFRAKFPYGLGHPAVVNHARTKFNHYVPNSVLTRKRVRWDRRRRRTTGPANTSQDSSWAARTWRRSVRKCTGRGRRRRPAALARDPYGTDGGARRRTHRPSRRRDCNSRSSLFVRATVVPYVVVVSEPMLLDITVVVRRRLRSTSFVKTTFDSWEPDDGTRTAAVARCAVWCDDETREKRKNDYLWFSNRHATDAHARHCYERTLIADRTVHNNIVVKIL